MYYLGKLIQAVGLTILLIAWIKNFPHLMSYETLGLGIGIFTLGWVLNRFLLKK